MTGMSTKRLNLSEAAGAFWRDLKYALRSLAGAKGLTITVVFTLALGIGANAAIFTLVRGVLLRPLVNRGEDRLVYIRQSARGMGDGERRFFRAGDAGPAAAGQVVQCHRRFLDDRFHPEWAGRAARGAGGSGGRHVFRRDGPASGNGAAAGYARRRPVGRRRRGSDVPLLDHRAEERPDGAWKGGPAGIVRNAHRDGRRGIGTVASRIRPKRRLSPTW